MPRLLNFSRVLKASLLLGCVSAWAAAGLAQDAPKLKVAIVGLEHGHVEGLLHQLKSHPEVELVGIADADPELVAKYEKRYSFPDTLFYKTEAEMVEKTHPQAVLVYTSIGEHRHAIEIAAQYGVSVMVEKPLTISLDDALAIREIAKKDKIQVLTNYETTWYSSNKAAYDDVKEGKLGAIRRVVVHDGHEGPKEIGVSPEFFKWLTDPATNGAGAMYDFGCYGVDLMTWLMKGETPLTVSAVVTHDKPEIYPKVEDDSTITLTYPHAEAVIMGSWNWPFARKDMEVYGATGYAITVGPEKMRVRLPHEGEEEPVATAPELSGAESNSLSYLEAVMSGKLKPEGDLTALDTNVIVMQILDAARESVRTGKTVKLRKIGE